VVLAWIGPIGPKGHIIALPSAGVGLLVGAIAGALGKPLRGAIVGLILSAFVFELFMFACASLIGGMADLLGHKGAESEFLTEMLPYTLLMGLAGAAAGGIGGAVGSATRKNGKSTVKMDPGPQASDESDAAGDRTRD
jgi:hypothetical protein